jgi:hypothetical protein
MGESDKLANTCRDAAAVWRRLAAEALSDDERREALAYVELFEKAAEDLDRALRLSPLNSPLTPHTTTSATR